MDSQGQDTNPFRHSTRTNFSVPPTRFGDWEYGHEQTGGRQPAFTSTPHQTQPEDTRSVTSRVSHASQARQMQLAVDLAAFEERKKIIDRDHKIQLQQLELDRLKMDAELEKQRVFQELELKKLQIQQQFDYDQEIEDGPASVHLQQLERQVQGPSTQLQRPPPLQPRPPPIPPRLPLTKRQVPETDVPDHDQIRHPQPHTEQYQPTKVQQQFTANHQRQPDNDDGWSNHSDDYSEMSDSRQLRGLTEAMTRCFDKLAEAQRPRASSTTITEEMKLSRHTIGKVLTEFDGTPADWPAFLSEYKECTELCKYSDRENLQRLRKALKGKAKEVVQSLLNAPENVAKIMETLEQRFGKPAYIMHELISKAKCLPTLTDDKPAMFLDFSTAIQNLVTTAKSLECKEHLCNPQLLMDLVNKLPNHQKYDWGAYAASKATPNLEDFGEWVSLKAKAVSIFTVPNFDNDETDKTTEEKSEPRKRQGKVLATAKVTGTSASDTMSMSGSKPTACICCDKSGHTLDKCSTFAKLDMDDRWKLFTDNKRCFSCLDATHPVKLCDKKKVCGEDDCKYFHHPLLHKEKSTTTAAASESKSDSTPSDGKVLLSSDQPINNKTTIYQILPVTLHGPSSQLETYAIIDNGSYLTLLDSSVAVQLGLTGQKTPLQIKGVSDMVSVDQDSMAVSLRVSGRSGKEYQLDNVRTKTNLDMPMQTLDVGKLARKWKLVRKFGIQNMKNAKPMLLIGLDNVKLIATDKLIRSPRHDFVLGRTLLGWSVFRTDDHSQQSNGHVLFIHKYDEDLHHAIQEQFKLENLGIKINDRMTASVQDRRATDVMNLTTRRVGDKWKAGLIWKNDDVTFPNNKPEAPKRLIGIGKRMDRDPEFAKLYYEKMQYYFDKNFARKLTKEEADSTNVRTWYIPHFGVFNPNKPGKIRLVFDAAAKCKGTSLTDQLMTRPDLLISLPGSIIKFRERAIGFSGDMNDFSPSVRIRPNDEDSQRFLWSGADRQRNPDVYVLQVCIFGAAACQSARMKMLLLDIWRSDLGWVDQITDRVYEKWKNWTDQPELVPELRTPRSTKLNLADVLTEDSAAVPLDPDDEWFKGPSFLYQPQDKWPKEKPPDVTSEDILDLRPETAAVIMDQQLQLPAVSRFNSWPKGRITETFSWKEGQVRAVEVKTATGGLKRPVPKILKLNVKQFDIGPLDTDRISGAGM